MRIALALSPLLALVACGNGTESNSVAPVETATPVEATAAEAGKSWADTVTKGKEGYILGNPNAAIKLVEYGSRSCPTCARFASEGFPVLRENYVKSGKVSYEYRDFLVHGAPDLSLALLNQCVPTEAFFDVLDQLFASQYELNNRIQNLQRTNPALLQQLQAQAPAQAAAGFAQALGHIEFMKQRGVPEAKARECLTNKASIEQIAKVNADAVSVHKITGTPSFFLNGKQLEGAFTWSQIEPALQAAGAR